MANNEAAATDGALGGVIASLTKGGGGMTGTGAALGTAVGGPVGGVIGGVLGLAGDVFSAVGSSDQDERDKEHIETLNRLRSSREWIEWE